MNENVLGVQTAFAGHHFMMAVSALHPPQFRKCDERSDPYSERLAEP